MAKSLIEELPRIVSEGRREAAQILERPQIPNAFNLAADWKILRYAYKFYGQELSLL